MMNNWRYPILLVVLTCVISGCSSNVQKKQFYTLHQHSEQSVNPVQIKGSIGIGPVELPESFQGDRIVSFSDEQRIIKSNSHLWAGDFKQAMSRTLAADISQAYAYDDVWPFPWDTRHRPQYQISLLVEQLGGVLGGDVQMSLKWTLFEDHGRKIVAVGREDFIEKTTNSSYESYVAAINKLVNQCSIQLQQLIRERLPES